MLQLSGTRIHLSRHSNVLPGILIPEEGMALVFVKQNGETFVRPSTGAAGEIFAGVSWERFSPPGRLPYFREFEIPANGVVPLPRTPGANEISVFEGTTAVTTATGDTAPTDTSAVISGDRLLFAPRADGDAPRNIRVQMLYAPTVDEANQLTGVAPFGGHPQAATGTIGRLMIAEISTSHFDVTKDWTNVLGVALGDGGIFVPAAANGSNRLLGVVVNNSPSAANPYLELTLNVI